MSHADQLHSTGDAHDGDHPHVTPFWTMFWVFVVLLVLTALTVWSSNLHYFYIGNTEIKIGATAHILLALAIATVKAILVGAYFMHLLYDKAVNTIVVASTLFATTLFIGLTLLDFNTRGVTEPEERSEIVAGGLSQVVDSAQQNAAQGEGNPMPAEAAAEAGTGDASAAGQAAPEDEASSAPGDGEPTGGG